MEASSATEIVDAFKQYLRAFASQDPKAILAHYHEPCLVASDRGVVALPTSAEIEQFFARRMAESRAEGYASTEVVRLEGRRLGEALAIVSGVLAWKKASGEELRRFGLTYTLYRTGPAWKIAAAVIHDPEAARPGGGG